MKLQLLSDLHFEMHRDKGNAFIDSLDPSGVDVLVMAGDIMYLNFFDAAEPQIRKLLDKYNKIIYVMGNHEYYTSSVDVVHRVVERLREAFPDKLYIFDKPGKCQIDGQHFICGPMWYRNDPHNVVFQDMMNDDRLIKGFLPHWVYEQNELFEHLVNGSLAKNDVVISHYLPSGRCVAKQYRGSALNRFFVCDMEKIILERKPKLWCYGHTHVPSDLMIGSSRVICNPFGYPSEGKKSFRDKLIIDI